MYKQNFILHTLRNPSRGEVKPPQNITVKMEIREVVVKKI